MPPVLLFLFLPMLVAASPPLPFADPIALRGTQQLITVNLETELGAAIENATIYFYHEEVNSLLGTATTNGTGHAVFAWQIPLAHKLGLTSLNATFPGDEQRHLLPCYVRIPLTVIAQTKLAVIVCDEIGNIITESVYPDQILVFTVYVHDDLAQPLQGILVYLLGAGNQTIGTGSTAQNGAVIFEHRLGPVVGAAVSFKVQSSSLGFFKGSEAELQYAVEKSQSWFVGLPSFLRTGQAVVAGRLRHQYADKVPMARIRVLLDGSREIAVTMANQEGRFCHDLNRELQRVVSGRFLMVLYDGDSSHTPTLAVIGLILARTATPFSQLIKVVFNTPLSEALYWIGLVAATCTGVFSAYLTFRIRRTTTNIVSH